MGETPTRNDDDARVDRRWRGIKNVDMASEPTVLNPKQKQVLEWIRNGCPDGVYASGYEHRISARVLERRGLVKIRGRGEQWQAELTEKGKQWKNEIKNTELPLPHGRPTHGRTSSDEVAAPEEAQAAEQAAQNEASEEDELLKQVLDQGSVLLPEDASIVKSYERMIRRSLSSPLRPRGKRLEMQSTGQWGLGPQQIVFVDYFDDRVEITPVPVPERISKYHPSIKELLSNKEWSYVSDEHLPRAAKILQAIADEAERRGLKVLSTEQALRNAPQYRQRKLRSVPLRIEATDGLYTLEIREISAPGAKKLPTRSWNEKKTLPSWKEQRGWEFISTGILELIIDGPGAKYSGDRYKDAKTISLEEKLPKALASFEVYRLKNEWREQERARVEAERLKSQMEAREVAKAKYFEAKRWDHFIRQSNQWTTMNRHREFLSKAFHTVTTSPSTQQAAVLAELKYAESKLNENDPLLNPALLIPQIPDPTEEDLKPFLPSKTQSLFSGLF